MTTAPSTPGTTEPAARRRPWVAIAGVVATVSVLAGVLGFGLSRDPTGTVRASPLIGKPAPDFSLRTLDGDRTIRLRDLRGQVVVLNFWASWCAECRFEHDDLRTAWNLYRDRGAVIVGVMYQDSEAGARAYLEELGGDWPILQDPESRAAIDYGVYGAPETVFVSPEGIVAHRVIGPVTITTLSSWIVRLSKGRA